MESEKENSNVKANANKDSDSEEEVLTEAEKKLWDKIDEFLKEYHLTAF